MPRLSKRSIKALIRFMDALDECADDGNPARDVANALRADCPDCEDPKDPDDPPDDDPPPGP